MIEAALARYLASAPTVAAIVGDRIAPLKSAHGVDLPRITYLRVGGENTQYLGGNEGVVMSRLQLACWAETYVAAKGLLDAVLAARAGEHEGGDEFAELDGFRGSWFGTKVQGCFSDNPTDELEQPEYADADQIPNARIDLIIWHE